MRPKTNEVPRCKYNTAVECDFQVGCEKCGWFPEEWERRVKEKCGELQKVAC